MNPTHPLLVVDDDSLNLELTPSVLNAQSTPLQVAVARAGREALDYLYRRGNFKSRSGEEPAVVLLDLKMPLVDGFEVLRQVKNDNKLKVIPVVVFTSSSHEEDMNKCYQLAANAPVLNPADFTHFS